MYKQYKNKKQETIKEKVTEINTRKQELTQEIEKVTRKRECSKDWKQETKQGIFLSKQYREYKQEKIQ